MTWVISLCEEDYNSLLDGWLIPMRLYYALMGELRRSQGSATPSASDSGSEASEERGNPDDIFRADAMCPKMRMAPSALRYDCDAYSSHTSGDLCKRMDRNCRADHPVGPVVPFFPKGKGKNYSFPPWCNHHFGTPDPPSRDEEEAPVENAMTPPQESFDLPNDMVHTHRYGFARENGMKVCLLFRVSLPTP